MRCGLDRRLPAGSGKRAGGLGTEYWWSDTPGAITRSYPAGGVQFGATSTVTANAGTTGILSPAPAYSFAYSGLPGGIVSNGAGRFTIAGSTAAPGTYGSVGVTATDQYGAGTQSTFQLVVQAQPVSLPGNYGDMVTRSATGSMSTSSTSTPVRSSPAGPRPRPTRRPTSSGSPARSPERTSSSTRPTARPRGCASRIPAAAGPPIRCLTACSSRCPTTARGSSSSRRPTAR